MSESERKVFVIHGRNDRIRSALFSFLRAAGLEPLEWSEAVKLTGKGAPYIGEILDHAFKEAAAVVVVLTPDDLVRLSGELVRPSDGSDERETQLQPRPNVIFEAGMAFGRYPERTILVAVGRPKEFSDVAGRHVIHLTNDPKKRLDLLERLDTAGCDVRSKDRRDWLGEGDFDLDLDAYAEIEVNDNGVADLTGVQEEVLQVVADSDEVVAAEVAPKLEISRVEAEHHLETLTDRDYLFDRHSVGQPTAYLLDKKGRAYMVKHGLV